jgi:hypothetical protein
MGGCERPLKSWTALVPPGWLARAELAIFNIFHISSAYQQQIRPSNQPELKIQCYGYEMIFFGSGSGYLINFKFRTRSGSRN